MRERIESKVNEYILSIIEKREINKDDYSVLVSELNRLKIIEDNAKWEASQEDRIKAMVKTLMVK